jgi:hypothetical protein
VYDEDQPRHIILCLCSSHMFTCIVSDNQCVCISFYPQEFLDEKLSRRILQEASKQRREEERSGRQGSRYDRLGAPTM